MPERFKVESMSPQAPRQGWQAGLPLWFPSHSPCFQIFSLCCCFLLEICISCLIVNISFKYGLDLWICFIYISSDLKRVLSCTITNTPSRFLALWAYDQSSPHCCIYFNAKERRLQLASMWHEAQDWHQLVTEGWMQVFPREKLCKGGRVG